MPTTPLQLLEQAVDETYADLALHHRREHPETRQPPKTAAEARNLELSDASFNDAVRAHEQAIKAAIRAGSSHPRVRAWTATQRDHGQWDLLRGTHKGLEKGVRRPFKLEDVWLAAKVSGLIEKCKQDGKRCGPEQLRRLVMATLKGLARGRREDRFINQEAAAALLRRLEDMSRQGWHKWLTSLNK